MSKVHKSVRVALAKGKCVAKNGGRIYTQAVALDKSKPTYERVQSVALDKSKRTIIQKIVHKNIAQDKGGTISLQIGTSKHICRCATLPDS